MIARDLGLSRRWRYRASALLAACTVLCAAPLHAQSSGTLTSTEIDEAIEWGTKGDPTPYLLHHLGRPEKPNLWVVGAVYTPFLRVALAAKAARASGRDEFSARDVTPDLLEPVIYVAFRWYCCVDSDHGTDTAWDPFAPPVDYKIAAAGDWVAGVPNGLRVPPAPLWTSYDLSKLTRFGDPPYSDLVMVAAYPLDVLRSLPSLIIYRHREATSSRPAGAILAIGQVTAEDVPRWR